MTLVGNTSQHQAILDIGSNSLHFVVYKIEKDKSFSVVFRKRIVYRLAQQKQHGRSFLSDEDYTQTEKILLECNEIAKSFSSTITATATSAVRESINENKFIKQFYFPKRMFFPKTSFVSILEAAVRKL